MAHIVESGSKILTIEELAKFPDSKFRGNKPPFFVILERAGLSLAAKTNELKEKYKKVRGKNKK